MTASVILGAYLPQNPPASMARPNLYEPSGLHRRSGDTTEGFPFTSVGPGLRPTESPRLGRTDILRD